MTSHTLPKLEDLSAALAGHETDKGYAIGTHRTVDPAETFARIAPKFSLMGITRISDVTGLDNIGIPVCMSVRPNSKSLSVSQGKGVTLMAAKVSAAMESVEGYHAENIQAELVTASYAELSRQGSVLDPRRLKLQQNSAYHPDLPITWMLGYDLASETEVYVPYELVRVDFLLEPPSAPLFWRSSNGLASGNHILEAASHALCEVVERDSMAMWEITAVLPERDNSYVDLATIDSPTIRDVIEKLRRAGVEVIVSNQTSAIGIPSFGCDLFVRDAISASVIPTYSGMGCHLSKEVAILRAITEAVQSRLTLIAGSRDDMNWNDYRHAPDGISRQRWVEHLRKVKPAADYRSIPSLETSSLAGDVARQISLLRAAGFEQVVALDLTKPEIDIPVARVIIPGAEVNLGPRSFVNPERRKERVLQKLMEIMER